MQTICSLNWSPLLFQHTSMRLRQNFQHTSTSLTHETMATILTPFHEATALIFLACKAHVFHPIPNGTNNLCGQTANAQDNSRHTWILSMHTELVRAQILDDLCATQKVQNLVAKRKTCLVHDDAVGKGTMQSLQHRTLHAGQATH